ncbi:MAG: PAS domain-containing protein [Bacteroidales bacterium]
MSEFIANHQEHYQNLYNYCCGIAEGSEGRALYDKYRSDIESVSPEETMHLLDDLLQKYDFARIKEIVAKLINIFYKSLNSREWKKPQEGHFLYYLMLENEKAKELIERIRDIIKKLNTLTEADHAPLYTEMGRLTAELKSYELHYIKKENILFPYLEATFAKYRCIQLMWSFHDDFRSLIKQLEELLKQPAPDMKQLNRVTADLFFVILPIVFREEQIVFPVAYRSIPSSAWHEMMQQSHETGWCYIQLPAQQASACDTSPLSDGLIDLFTGALTREQIILLLETMPVDVTFVDENDAVRYFSGSAHRIFPRSKAIIGRKVHNCHPPESVHMVTRIIEAFRKGEKDNAAFWINLRGKFIHVRYFALRDSDGTYRGTIEVSQDITEIRSLEGERRLLDWE